MTEYLKDLERQKPGDPPPPINCGPYDNPLLWNFLDPFAKDRPHQRRPTTVSRNDLELYNIRWNYRDGCAHRFIPWKQCMLTARAMMFGSNHCVEAMDAYAECAFFELYRLELLKNKFIELTRSYTPQEKRFFPNGINVGRPFHWTSSFWTIAADCRLSGADDNDPQNPFMWREPNRALMRSEFAPSNWEYAAVTNVMCKFKNLPKEWVENDLPGYPLPEDKRPKEHRPFSGY